jgi:signal transduction histidine kinase
VFQYRNFWARLQVRLLMILLLILIPMFLLFAYFAREQQRFETESVQMEALRLAQLTASNHGQLIRGGEHLLVALSQVPEVYNGDVAACNEMFVRLREEYQIYTNVFMVDANGDTVCTGLPDAPPVNVFTRTWFIRTMERKAFSVADYELGAVTRRPVVTMSYPIFDEEGEIKYFVGAALDLLRVNQFLTEADLPPETFVTAIDRQGTILYRYPTGDEWVGQRHPNLSLVERVVSEGEGIYETIGIGAEDRIYGFSPLDTTNYSAFLLVGITTDTAFAQLNQLSLRTFLLFAFVGLVTLAGGWTVVRMFFVRQVQTLVDTTNRFAEGKLESRVDLQQVKSISELRQVGQAFNNMAESLQQREQALTDARNGLEAAVQKRTRELNFLLQASGALASSLDYRTTLDSVAKLAVPDFADWCAVNLLKEDGTLEQVAVAHKDPEKVRWALEMQERFPPNPNTPHGVYHVVRTKRHEIVPRVTDEMLKASVQDPDYLEYLRQIGFSSVLIVPLLLREEVIGTLSLIMSESGRQFSEADLPMAVELARRSAIAIENARLYQQSKEYAANEERQRLARDLHDAVSQTLFTANIISQALPRLFEKKPQRAMENVHQLTQLTRSAIAEMRTLLLELRPSALLDSKLFDLLTQLGEAAKGRHRMNIEMISQGEHHALPPDVQITLYRVAQESLNNIIKHSGASEVVMSLRMETPEVELTIRDNGKGFDMRERRAGIGLHSMRERAESIGARFSITSETGKGTTIRLLWCPVQQPQS